MSEAETTPLELATEITIAWLSNANTRASAEDVPAFLRTILGEVTQLSQPANAAQRDDAGEQDYAPAVSARRSLASKDHILSMIDGKPYKSLRRHLGSHGLTPEQYRERYKLRPDYPMVAESYSEQRRAMAKKIGLGRKPKASGADAASTSPDAPKRGRRPKAAAQ